MLGTHRTTFANFEDKTIVTYQQTAVVVFDREKNHPQYRWMGYKNH